MSTSNMLDNILLLVALEWTGLLHARKSGTILQNLLKQPVVKVEI